MTKQEVFARLKKLQLLERLSITTETNAEAGEELDKMENSPEAKEKDLTTEPSNV